MCVCVQKTMVHNLIGQRGPCTGHLPGEWDEARSGERAILPSGNLTVCY